jgi:RHS repeat-associated protein
VQQQLGGSITTYIWDEASRYGDVVLESDGSGTPLASYTLAQGQLLAQQRGGAGSYYLHDAQGNVRTLTDGTGSISDAYTYTSFGELRERQGTSENPYQYTGQRFDTLTGLYDLRARSYDPAVGRFLSRDTWPINVANPVELNRYGYTANNPVNASDPSGYLLAEFGVQGNQSVRTMAGAAAIGGATAVRLTMLMLGAWGLGSYVGQFAADAIPPLLHTGHGLPSEPPFQLPGFPLAQPRMGDTILADPLPAATGITSTAFPLDSGEAPLTRSAPWPALEEPGLAIVAANAEFQGIVDRITAEGKLLSPSQARVPNPNAMPQKQVSDGTTSFTVVPNLKYLWVIDESGNLIIAPEGIGQSAIKHVQLTEYGKAYGAGEVWFRADGTVDDLNLESGRYMAYNINTKQITQSYLTTVRQWANELFKALNH